MKKTAIILALMIALASSGVFAQEGAEPSGQEASAGTRENLTYTVKINGSELDLKGAAVINDGANIMVPLRVTAEALGFTVSWSGETQTVELDDGMVKTQIKIGVDSYYKASSQAVGMTASFQYGSAPVIGEDSNTYVPVVLFNLLYSNENAVVIDGTQININKNNTTAQVPSPMKRYDTLKEAQAALGWNVKVPGILPNGYKLEGIYTISGQILQLTFKNGDKIITYRTAEGDEDISGDYNQYETEKTVKIGNTDILMKGKENKVYTAVWNYGKRAYSLYAESGITSSEMIGIISNIQ